MLKVEKILARQSARILVDAIYQKDYEAVAESLEQIIRLFQPRPAEADRYFIEAIKRNPPQVLNEPEKPLDAVAGVPKDPIAGTTE